MDWSLGRHYYLCIASQRIEHSEWMNKYFSHLPVIDRKFLRFQSINIGWLQNQNERPAAIFIAELNITGKCLECYPKRKKRFRKFWIPFVASLPRSLPSEIHSVDGPTFLAIILIEIAQPQTDSKWMKYVSMTLMYRIEFCRAINYYLCVYCFGFLRFFDLNYFTVYRSFGVKIPSTKNTGRAMFIAN